MGAILSHYLLKMFFFQKIGHKFCHGTWVWFKGKPEEHINVHVAVFPLFHRTVSKQKKIWRYTLLEIWKKNSSENMGRAFHVTTELGDEK